MREEAVVVLRLDASGVPEQAKVATNAVAGVAQKAEVSAKQAAFAMRQLPAQFTDIFTGLASGQNPLTVLIQQGGQIRDSFGSAGAALRAVGSLISPFALGVGAAAGAIGLLAKAAYDGAAGQAKLRDALALTGNAAGLTADTFEDVAARVARGTQQTVGASRQIVLELARTGQVSGSVLESTARAVARVADVTGEDAGKVVADFARMSGGVAKWAAEHNKAWNFITVEQFKYIRSLEEQGRSEDAAIEVNRRVVEQLSRQQEELGLLERAYNAVRQSASQFWSSLLALGRDTPLTRLQSARERLGRAERVQGMPIFEWLFGGVDRAQADVDLANRDLLRSVDRAIDQSEAAARNRNAIDEEIKRGKQRQQQSPLGAIRDAREQYKADFLRSEKAFYTEWERLQAEQAELAKKDPLGDFISTRVLPADAERQDRRLRQFDRYLDDLRDANDRAGVSLIEDERARGRALIELDRQMQERRLQQMELTEGQRAEAMTEISRRAALGLSQLEQQFDRSRERGAEFGSTIAYAFESAILGAKSLSQALSGLARDLASLLIRRFITEPLAANIGNVAAAYFRTTGTTRAAGGPVSAGTPYLVGERGPEVFVPRASGAIIPNGAAMAAATYAPTIVVQGDVGPATVALVERMLARERARWQRQQYALGGA